MTFALDKTNENFSTSRVHKFLRYDTLAGKMAVVVNSYASLEALKQVNLLNWQSTFEIPPEQAANPEAWLISPTGPYAGATMLPEETPLEEARSYIWAQFKTQRDQLEFGTFTYQNYAFDCSPLATQRIFNAAMVEQIHLQADTPTVVDWTTADNKVVTLSSEEVVEMAQALRAHVDKVHQTAKTIRDQLNDPATDTIEKLYAIQWPI